MKTILKPIITYGLEVATLTRTEEKALWVFERLILRGIFGPVKDTVTGEFRIWMNHELEQLFGEPDIVTFIQARRMSWLGHIYRIPDERMPRKIPLKD